MGLQGREGAGSSVRVARCRLQPARATARAAELLWQRLVLSTLAAPDEHCLQAKAGWLQSEAGVRSSVDWRSWTASMCALTVSPAAAA